MARLISNGSTPSERAMSGMAGVMIVASRISMNSAPATSSATPRGADTLQPPHHQPTRRATLGAQGAGRRSVGSAAVDDDLRSVGPFRLRVDRDDAAPARVGGVHGDGDRLAGGIRLRVEGLGGARGQSQSDKCDAARQDGLADN